MISPFLIRRLISSNPSGGTNADCSEYSAVATFLNCHIEGSETSPTFLLLRSSGNIQRSFAPLRMTSLFLPNVAEPAGRDDFLLRVKLHAFFALNVQIAVEGFVPTCEWEHRHRCGHSDIDSDHSSFDPVFEFASGFARVGENGCTVSVSGFVGGFDGMVEVVHAHDVKHRPEDFFARDGHVVLHLIDNRRAQIKSIWRVGDLNAATVGNNLCAFLFST